MPVRHVLAALLLASGAGSAAAQTVTADDLIAKNLAARGGAEALAAIKGVKFAGRVIFPGDFELTYAETRSQGSSRIDMALQGMTLVQGYDGKSGWRINPFQGRKDAERMSADEARSVADASLIEGPLQASRRDGSRVTYLGREDFDGTLAYKVKVAQKDGDEFVYWLDPDTFLEIKVDETRRIRGAEQTSETELGDYEKIAGVYFPMSVESWSEGDSNNRQRVIIASGSANPPVDLALFAEPKTPAAAQPGGSPPDASNAPARDDTTTDKPDAAEPANPPKGN
ncbi:hypothetical protein [Sphingomonas sp.]|uniref:hypothetical protein n=1 Tax=Sphingomonas sp. TaxID=28214 RepID=UPI00286E8A95|nr:hypothetical protein [Sphingomonas sp.]